MAMDPFRSHRRLGSESLMLPRGGVGPMSAQELSAVKDRFEAPDHHAMPGARRLPYGDSRC